VWGRYNLAPLQHEGGLDESGNPGGSTRVANVSLDRTEPAGTVSPAGAERRREPLHLDRIADAGGSAMRFDVADLGRFNSGNLLRHLDHVTLADNGWRGIAHLCTAVVVDR
jgi:hypothetical protein